MTITGTQPTKPTPGPHQIQTVPASTIELVNELSKLTPTESQPIPREIQRQLLESYTVPQLVYLAIHSREVKTVGWGALKIIFKKGIARLLETHTSDDLP